jgi:hypothetical protein
VKQSKENYSTAKLHPNIAKHSLDKQSPAQQSKELQIKDKRSEVKRSYIQT